MHKKLLASDWDGTLSHKVLKDGELISVVSDEDLQAIKEFRRQGNYFALCTGRTPGSVREVLRAFPELEVDGFILASGGAIYQSSRQNPVEIKEEKSFLIPAKDSVEFIRYFHDTGKYKIHWSSRTINYGLAERNPAQKNRHQGLSIISLDEWIKKPEDVICFGLAPFSGTEEDAFEALDVILSRWGNTMTGFRNTSFVDVCAKGVSKGTGLRYLKGLLANNYESYVIGDAQNDIPMFEEAGKNYAFRMEQGVPELQNLASRSVRSVAECIQQLLDEPLS
ncbi:MAG: HAD-IIB family hydrolase [Brevinema sp.]